MPGLDQHYPVFHKSLLTPYKEPSQPWRKHERPEPEIVDDNLQYEIEHIIQHKKHRRGWKFLIKWKGYPDLENTWEPESGVKKNAAWILNAYKKQKGLLVREISVDEDSSKELSAFNLPVYPAGHWMKNRRFKYTKSGKRKRYLKALIYNWKEGNLEKPSKVVKQNKSASID